jgi:hypothetical protein
VAYGRGKFAMMKIRFDQKGQFMIEAILLIVVMLSVMTVLIRGMKETQLANKMVNEPWAKISGLAEFGVWTDATDQNRKKHPNSYARLYTPDIVD